MGVDRDRLDWFREGRGEIANHVIDEIAAARISRRDFLRRGSAVGISVLLNETPIIYGYFYNHLSATAKNVAGVYPTASGHLFLKRRSRPERRGIVADS